MLSLWSAVIQFSLFQVKIIGEKNIFMEVLGTKQPRLRDMV